MPTYPTVTDQGDRDLSNSPIFQNRMGPYGGICWGKKYEKEDQDYTDRTDLTKKNDQDLTDYVLSFSLCPCGVFFFQKNPPCSPGTHFHSSSGLRFYVRKHFCHFSVC